MTEVKQNVSLKNYNTFGINIRAKFFVEYNAPKDITSLIQRKDVFDIKKTLILGGGSNLLFTKEFDGLIIYPVNNTIEIIEETEDNVFIKVGAGKDWDEFVEFAVNKDLCGIENLSNIPGNVGAAPVQNIGAYGVEVKDVIHSVNTVDLTSGEYKTLTNKACKFGYRNSIFKQELKNKILVDSVVFKLSKTSDFNVAYGSLQKELEKISNITLKSIRQVIIKIRESKLPDPKKIGNGGSFFKNPVIETNKASQLKETFPDMVTYPAGDGLTKIAAGWLIEHAGLKGFTNENSTAGVHNKQALVLVNKGGATGTDILNLANFVKQSILDKFGITLEPEVIFI